MSKSQEKTSPISIVRRAQQYDLEAILYLTYPITYQFFGEIDIGMKMQRCFLTMVVENEDSEIIAAICLDDHPNISSIPAWDWHSWIINIYSLHYITVKNSLWIHFLVCDPKYMYMFMRPLLEQIFLDFPHLLHIMIVAPGGITPMDYIEGYFSRVMPVVGYVTLKNVQAIYLTFRHHYAKKYKIRRAVEEDNDDLVAIIHSHSKRLKDMYGDFYISEILTKYPDMNRQLVVAEYDQTAVAVLILNSDINYYQLNKSFELEPYLNLCKRGESICMNISDDFTETRTISQISSSISNSFGSISDGMQNQAAEEMIKASEMSSLSSYSGSDDISALNMSTIKLITRDVGKSLEDFERGPTVVNTPIGSSKNHSVAPSKSNSIEKKKLSYEKENDNDEFVEDNMKEYGTFRKTTLKSDGSVLRYHIIFKEENSNAFILEIMAAAQEHEAEVLCDLLEACFQSFPNRDYCLILIPAVRSFFPLMNYFTKVVPRRRSTNPQDLYVLHRNAIKAELIVRPAVLEDRKGIDELVYTIENKEGVLRDALQVLYNSESINETYVMLDRSVIVAFAVLREETDFDYIKFRYDFKSYFDVRAHKYDKVGVLQHVVYSPIFIKHSQFFLREIHRLSDMSILMFKINQDDIINVQRERHQPSILKSIFPVRIRPLPKFPKFLSDDEIVVPDHVYRTTPPFALYISTPRLCSIPCEDVNCRLVMVGASNTGLSFLETLFCTFDNKKHLNFNNVTLIYAQNMATKTSLKNDEKHSFFVYRGHFTAQYLNSLALRTYVNFVNGNMTAIDRKNKYIVINDETIVPYDLLFLTCGEQYHNPVPSKKNENDEDNPCNVFIINKPADAEKAMHKLKKLMKYQARSNIIVYGATIHAYCCISTLQKIGIPSNIITFVEPFPHPKERPSLSFLNNPDLDKAIQDVLETEGITVHRSYYFLEWSYNENTHMVQSVRFESLNRVVDVDCLAMFYYDNKSVDFKTFSAINAAGLVYDGKLVIGPDCRTNDPNIFAAGPMTKYARKYYADHYSHKYFNSTEIGQRLARQVRAMLMPGGLAENEGDLLLADNKKWDLLVPQYEEPLLQYCTLPGGYHYFHIRKAGQEMPLESAMNRNDFGQIYVTGDLREVQVSEDPKFFRLHVNSRNIVETVTCLSIQSIDVENLKAIWGKHVKLLNNLTLRFEMGLITDFFEFFAQPSIFTLAYPGFETLQKQTQDIMCLLTETPGESLIEDLEALFEENQWKKLTPEQEIYVAEKFIDSGFHEVMAESVLDYLAENITYLPMFAHDLVTNLLLHRNEISPLFKAL